MKQKAIILFSGGVDSTTLLWLLRDCGFSVKCMTFKYGQKHSKEVDVSRTICDLAGVDQIVLDIPKLPGSALTEYSINIPKEEYSEGTQKVTVVPNRNMVFLSIAAAYAIAEKIELIAYAAHRNDEVAYPDCTPRFVDKLNQALSAGNYQFVQVKAPFIHDTKTDIIKKAIELGAPLEKTWSCYDPVEWENTLIHCGVCGTCRERKKAFVEAGIEDLTRYAK